MRAALAEKIWESSRRREVRDLRDGGGGGEEGEGEEGRWAELVVEWEEGRDELEESR